MKRVAGLLPLIATRENLALAFWKAAAGKRDTLPVRRFADRLDAELGRLVNELAEGSWRPGPYQAFTVRDPKVRTIHAAPFRDRVVHHAIMNAAGSHFERGALACSFACRTGKGNLAAIHHAARWTRKCRYFLKLDARRYFDSIQHSNLDALFRRRFKDADLQRLLGQVVHSFQFSPGCGLPIGTLTSQYFANFYLDGVDHFIVETLHCRAYARYMDDMVLWHDDADALEHWKEEIIRWLAAERRLALKGIPRVMCCQDGLPFLGYRLLSGRILLARRARRRFRQRLALHEADCAAGVLPPSQLQRRVDALLAFVQVADCHPWLQRVLAEPVNRVDC
jgi:retron-type reverse transcriptase